MLQNRASRKGNMDIKRSRVETFYRTDAMNPGTVCFVFLSFPLLGIHGEKEGSLKAVYKIFENCNAGTDLVTCLRLQAIKTLDQAVIADEPIVINEFVTITRDKEAYNSSESENEIETDLPSDPAERDIKLDQLMTDKILKYVTSRSLQFTIPGDIVEGRGSRKGGGGGKMGKKGGMLMMAGLAMGGMMLQMAMGKIALLAGKALLVGKMALVLSGVIALKKIIGSGGGGESKESHPQVVYAESHGGGHSSGWGRNYVKNENQIAYQAQARML